MSSARLIRIRGVVQGVGFRESMRREAIQLGLVGWVRNRKDSSVEALVQGDPAQLEAILTWSKLGPIAAVTAEEIPADPSLKSFERHETT